jgi:hypothetical protein
MPKINAKGIASNNPGASSGELQYETTEIDRFSDLFGLYEQQHNPADEREGSDDGRDEVAVGGLNGHAEEINRLSRGVESDARVGEHHDAKCHQNDGNNSFCVHV